MVKTAALSKTTIGSQYCQTMEKLMDRFGVSRATLYNYGLRKHPPAPAKPPSKRKVSKKR